MVLGTGLLPLPAPILVPVTMLAAMAAGALLLLGPAVLKTRFGVDEVVTTLLLNFIMLLFVSMLLEGPLKDPLALGWPQSQKLIRRGAPAAPDPAASGCISALPSLSSRRSLVWFVMARTALGFEMRAVGHNAAAARFAGIPVEPRPGQDGASLRRPRRARRLFRGRRRSRATSPSICRRASATPASSSPCSRCSTRSAWSWRRSSSPAIFVGADAMSRSAGVPSYIAQVMVATALLTMVVAIMLARYRMRWR